MPNTAQFILDRLTERGAKRVYAYPGDGINGLIGGLHEVGDQLDIQSPHEEIASFGGCVHAQLRASQALPEFRCARYAEVIEIKGIRVERPESAGPAWDEALAADGPVLYEASTDPEVPALPPQTGFAQPTKLARTPPGDPHAGGIIKESFIGNVEEFVARWPALRRWRPRADLTARASTRSR